MRDKSLKLNTILNILKTSSSILFPLITFPYISRILLPYNIGRVNFSSSFVSYFSLLASLGISTYAIRECSKVRNKQEELNNTASQIFSINIITTIISYILLGITIITFGKLEEYRMLIIIQSTIILFTTIGADWINSAMEDFTYITIRSVAFQILSLIMIFMFVRNSDDYLKYALITTLSSSGANITNFFYRKRYCKVKFTFDMQWKKHMTPIVLLFVMLLSQTIFNSADMTMLGLFNGNFEVGIYSTAYKIVNIISQMVASILIVLMPRLSYMFAENDYTKINVLLKKVFNTFMSLGIPCFTGAFVLSREIVLLVGGNEYINSESVLQILLVSFLFSLIGGSFLGNIVLLPSGREKLYMIICCISTVTNIILNLIFIPIFGADAAAMTTTFSSLIVMLLLLVTKDKRIQLTGYLMIIIKPLIGSVVLALYCLVIKYVIINIISRTMLCVGGSVLIYCLTQLILKNEIIESMMFSIKNKTVKLFERAKKNE